MLGLFGWNVLRLFKATGSKLLPVLLTLGVETSGLRLSHWP